VQEAWGGDERKRRLVVDASDASFSLPLWEGGEQLCWASQPIPVAEATSSTGPAQQRAARHQPRTPRTSQPSVVYLEERTKVAGIGCTIPSGRGGVLSVAKVLLSLSRMFQTSSTWNRKEIRRESILSGRYIEQTSIEFTSYSFVVSLSVPKLWRFETIGGSNTFATDGTWRSQLQFLVSSIIWPKFAVNVTPAIFRADSLPSRINSPWWIKTLTWT